MDTLFLLLLFIFGGVALMVFAGRFAAARTQEEAEAQQERARRLSRWIIPLVALSIVIQLIYLWTR